METQPLVDKYNLLRILETREAKDISRAYLHEQEIRGLVVDGYTLRDLHLSSTELILPRFLHTEFLGGELAAVNFRGGYFRSCTWRASQFTAVTFTDCVFDGCRFSIDEAIFRPGGLKFVQSLFLDLDAEQRRRLTAFETGIEFNTFTHSAVPVVTPPVADRGPGAVKSSAPVPVPPPTPRPAAASRFSGLEIP